MGPPACLMLEMGLAPVPPSWPLIWMTSAFALATPAATVPMPACATSFTLTLALGATCAAQQTHRELLSDSSGQQDHCPFFFIMRLLLHVRRHPV